MRGLNSITVVLLETPRVSIDDFVRAGINPEVLAKVELFGDWTMMLGPAMVMRVSLTRSFAYRQPAELIWQKACRACWNVRTEYMAGVAVSSPALLCEDVQEDDELFALCELLGLEDLVHKLIVQAGTNLCELTPRTYASLADVQAMRKPSPSRKRSSTKTPTLTKRHLHHRYKPPSAQLSLPARWNFRRQDTPYNRCSHRSNPRDR
jgi:hypothetical protein